MIRTVLYRDDQGRLTGFSAKGHAGYAESGSDIVCAGVSVLTTTCVNTLEKVCGFEPIVSGGKDGMLTCFLPARLTAEQQHDAQVIMQFLEQGLRDLAESYNKYIKLSVQERRETQ